MEGQVYTYMEWKYYIFELKSIRKNYDSLCQHKLIFQHTLTKTFYWEMILNLKFREI